jgi:hypothetical protein
MQTFDPTDPDASKGPVMHFQTTNISEGCGRIFDTNNGAYFEYTLGMMDDRSIEVFGVALSNNIVNQFSHVLVDQGLSILLRTIGLRREIWLKKAKGTLEQRAECILDIAAVFGWDVIDDEPHTYSKAELAARWFDEFKSEGPVTTATETNFPLFCSELLIALHSIDPNQYWSMMGRDFPVIPPEALNDSGSNWWQQHGKAAVAKIVSAIEQVCPPGFEFSVREHRFGFWKQDRLGHGANTTESGSA